MIPVHRHDLHGMKIDCGSCVSGSSPTGPLKELGGSLRRAVFREPKWTTLVSGSKVSLQNSNTSRVAIRKPDAHNISGLLTWTLFIYLIHMTLVADAQRYQPSQFKHAEAKPCEGRGGCFRRTRKPWRAWATTEAADSTACRMKL